MMEPEELKGLVDNVRRQVRESDDLEGAVLRFVENIGGRIEMLGTMQPISELRSAAYRKGAFMDALALLGRLAAGGDIGGVK